MSDQTTLMSRGLAAGFAAVMSASAASAAPIYSETFAGNTLDDAKTAISGVTTISGEAAHVVTTVASQEGAIVASGLGVSANSEYVISMDVTVNGPTQGPNFQAPLLYNGGVHDLWVLIGTYGDGDWEVSVTDANGDTVTDHDYSYGQTVTIALHHTANVDDEIDVYLNGGLFGTFVDIDPTKALNLLIVGDGSGGTSTGDVTYDNISVALGPIPEPASLAMLGVGGLAMLRRRK